MIIFYNRNKWLTSAELERIGISKEQLEQCKKKHARTKRLGRLVLYSLRDIQEYINNKKTKYEKIEKNKLTTKAKSPIKDFPNSTSRRKRRFFSQERMKFCDDDILPFFISQNPNTTRFFMFHNPNETTAKATTNQNQPVRVKRRSLPESLAFESREEALIQAKAVARFLSLAYSSIASDEASYPSSDEWLVGAQRVEELIQDLIDIGLEHSDMPLTDFRDDRNLPRLGDMVGTSATSKRFVN